MMRWTILAIVLFFSSIQARALDMSVQHATFMANGRTYVEVSIYILGNSLTFQTVDSLRNQASVDVTVLFLQGEEVRQFDRYRLVSEKMEIPGDIYHIGRYVLPEGQYRLEVDAVDGVDSTNTHRVISEVSILFDKQGIQQSDVVLLASAKPDTIGHPLAKNGIIMEPLGFNYYDRYANTLVFYNEVYGTGDIKEDILVHYAIYEPSDSLLRAPILERFKRKKTAEILPILMKMDISTLPSGRFKFVCEIWQLDKKILSSRELFFFRTNPVQDLQMAVETEVIQQAQFIDTLEYDDLNYAIRALVPRLAGMDIETANFLLEDKKPKYMRYFLYNYWSRTAPSDPPGTFAKYMEIARAVDRMYYSGFRRGFETDRGYIFLKYGKPDDLITVEDEVDAPPYEIWTYYNLPNSRQSNVKFLFYNPELTRNGFQLLHSTARGERQNPRWESVLYGSLAGQLPAGSSIDGGRVLDGTNRNARRLFNDN